MPSSNPLTILCLASYEKGHEFLRECKRQGCRVFLLTSESLKDTAEWPRESLDQIFYMPDQDKKWNRDDAILGVSYLGRREVIDRIVPLDDYDLEIAAALREHTRIPGMGDTTTRYFRDKLAMRTRALDAGIPVPEFVHVLNYDRLREFMAKVPPPWLIKPRFEASAIGIKKINAPDELWPAVDALGDRQSFCVMERYVPGTIYHVDSIISEREVVFAQAHQYGLPPMEVAHYGGLFSTQTMEPGTPDEQELLRLNRAVLEAMGHVRGVSHTEFIKGREDGRFYFLETSARVGGAHIVELVEASTGLNLWAEWAKIETRAAGDAYQLPAIQNWRAGLIISLARQEHPDTTSYDDPEIVWRLKMSHHVGLIVRSHELNRVQQLLQNYSERFRTEFFASEPLPDKPTS